MMKVQFETLSDNLSRDIRPFARRLEVAPIFPNQVDPLRVLPKTTQVDLPSAHPQDPEKSDTDINSTPVSEDTVSILTPVSI